MSRIGKSVRQRIKDSQEFKQYKLLGIYYDRILVGREPWFVKDMIECPNCYAKLGLFHVVGCAEEQSPWICKCPYGDRIINCNCEEQ